MEPRTRGGLRCCMSPRTPTVTEQASPPNVVLIVLDDLGFAQFGCFGSDLDTPHIDRVAGEGLRYNRFHVTALCSPTRACILTGRNHHRVGMGWLTEVPGTAPGYSAHIPPSAGTLPRMLRDSGYSTFAVGKWHLTPTWERSAAGPFERWPLGMGFERFYGFLGAETNQWSPDLVADNSSVPAPTTPFEGYHLTEDLADRAIGFVRDQQHARPGRPFFLYFAPGAMHAPHHVPEQWSDPYAGAFDAGWERWRDAAVARQQQIGVVPRGTEPTPRPSWVQRWDDLPADEQRLCARGMEVYAGFLTHTDAQVGRVLSFLETIGVLDNTIVLVLSDNGTSSEGGLVGSANYHRVVGDHEGDRPETLARVELLGGLRSFNHYAWGWAWAGNAPFWLWKRFTWLGGVRTPLIVRWPGRIGEPGAVRSQFCHAVDLLPTILDACGVEAPRYIDGHGQLSIDGRSLLDTFTAADAPSPRSTQYFEMVGSRSIYHDGWKATTDHVGPTPVLERSLIAGSHRFEDDHWALFNLDQDFAEALDISGRHPGVVDDLVARWNAEAEDNGVFPLDDRLWGRTSVAEPPQRPPRRMTFRPGGGPVSELVLPELRAGFRLIARFEAGSQGTEGVLCALGDWNQGWAWYALNDRMVFVCSLYGTIFRAEAGVPIGPGSHHASVEFRPGASAGGGLLVALDGEAVAATEVPTDLPARWQHGHPGLFVGHDEGLPVCDDYRPPFGFTGTLHKVVLEVTDPAPASPPVSSGRHTSDDALRHE